MKVNSKKISSVILSVSLALVICVLVFEPAVLYALVFAQSAEPQGSNPEKSKRYLIKAEKLHYNSRRYEADIDKWEEGLLLDPENRKIKKYIKEDKKKLERQSRRDAKLFSVTSPPGETNDILTLDDCINIAVENSLSLRIAKKNIKLAEMRIWEARRGLFPKISAVWEESEGRVQGKLYTGKKEYVEGQQTIPLLQGVEAYYVMKQAEVNLKVTKEEYTKTKNELVFQVKKGFYALLKAKENLKIQAELEGEVDRILDMVNRQHEANVASKLELLNVSSQASQVKYQLASAEGDESMAELVLKQTMDVDYRERIRIEPSLEFKKVDIDFERVLNAAFLNRPELKVNLLTVEYSKYEKDIAKAKGWPKIDIMGNWGLAKEEFASEDLGTSVDQKLEQQWYAGFKVGVPIWGSTGEYSITKEQWVPVVSAFHGTKAATHTAKFSLLDKLAYFSDKLTAEIGLDRARQDLEKTNHDVTQEARESCFGYEKALILLATAFDKLKYQEKDLEFIKLKRGMDEAQDSNVIESMIKLGQEKFGYVQALTDCHIAVAGINKAIGVEDYFRAETKERTKIDKGRKGEKDEKDRR